jgi:hypothetical protein
VHLAKRFMVGTAFLVLALAPPARADDASKDLQAYIDALHQNQYSDLAAEYLRQLERDPKTPASLKATLDYEIGAALMRLAETADVETERKAFDEASERFRKYLAANPNGESAIDSRNQMAYILLKRGQRALLIADAEAKPERKQAQRLEARKNFDQARKEFDDAVAAYQRAARAADDETPPRQLARLRDATTMAKMNRALTAYYAARTYDDPSPDRKKSLQEAERKFAEIVFETSRDTITVASIFAKIHQAKATLEMGDVRTAVDILEEAVVNETLARGRPTPELRSLFARARHELAAAFNAAGRHRDVAEGVYSAREWIERNQTASRTAEGLGVQLELARAYVALARGKKPDPQKAAAKEAPKKAVEPELTDAQKQRLLANAVRYLNNVARANSPYTREAFKLRGELAGEVTATKPATFEEAVEAAALFRDEEKWKEAAEAYQEALALKQDRTDAERVADVRYWITVAQLRGGDVAASVQTAKALVADLPRSRRAPQAAGLAVTAMLQLFRQTPVANRAPIAKDLVDFATLIEGQFQGHSAADDGRRARGYLAMFQQNYDAAAQAFAVVTKESEHFAECQLRLAQSLLRLLDGELRKPAAQQAAAVVDALKPRVATAFEASSKSQRAELLKPSAAGEQPDPAKITLPPMLIEAETGWTEFCLRFGDLAKAATLIEPIVAALQAGDRTDVEPNLATRALVAALEVANGRKDFAKADQLVEQVIKQGAEEPAKVTPTLVRIGQNLEAQYKQHRTAKNDEAAGGTLELLKRFLAKMGQRPKHDYRGLRYIAEANFNLGQHADAAKQFGDLLGTLKSNPPEVPERSRAGEAAYLRMRRIASLRMAGDFPTALAEVDQYIAELAPPGARTGYPLSQQMERGRILQDWGAKEPAKLADAVTQWLAVQRILTPLRNRPVEFYEVRLGYAQCLALQNNKPEALSVLRGTLALNPTAGSPAMKERYEDLLKTLE